MIAPVAITGAKTTILNMRVETICTCWISLVLRVIREAVENLFISEAEKDRTFRYTSWRRSLARAAAMRLERNVMRMAASIPISARPIILAPIESI